MQAAGRWLHGFLLVALGAPLLAFAWGTRAGEVVFVLYEEPKLAALELFGWCLLAALTWKRPSDLNLGPALSRSRRAPWCWWWLLLLYSLLTRLWVAVPANLWFELRQYFLVGMLVLFLQAWAERDPRIVSRVSQGLVLSAVLLTAVGLFQVAFPVPWLSPIDPGSGVANPSLMGYRSPAALALVGQICVLGKMIAETQTPTRRRWLALLLALELIYLATLESRTAYVALLVTGLFLLVAWALAGRSRTRTRFVPAVVLGLAVLASATLLNPAARERLGSVVSLATRPSALVQTDRGTYLLNSLNMVRHHPFGVGLGDWQTQYPVYRRYQRTLYFSETLQVRKAHDDHVQIFAELGWPGLVLWSGFLVGVVLVPLKSFLTTGEPARLLIAGQVVTSTVAMAMDSVLEAPWGKLQMLLVAFVATWNPAEPAVT
ncbi:MAG: O-antigen ligase family protein, partial [Thermoanaerobaculia bacterium]|nr:O-antigen ligase family protein [Thermoanaerobaculia bacterium]